MKKTLLIIAPPAHGKTTLVRSFMGSYSWAFYRTPFKHHKTDIGKKVYVLGEYSDGQMFSGTDKLQMSVQPLVVDFIEDNDGVFIAEGDRLGNQKFINQVNPTILYVSCNRDVVTQRLKSRGRQNTPQLNSFIKGRATKVDNILRDNPYYMIDNSTKKGIEDFNQFITGFLSGNLSNYNIVHPAQKSLF